MVRRALANPADGLLDSASQARASWLPPLIIVLAVVATFWVVSTAEFTSGDDQMNLIANPSLNPPTWSGLAHLSAHPYIHEYIPLSYTAWWLLARVAALDVPDAHGVKLNPYIFHSANLLLHIGACLVIYQLLRRLTGRTWAACGGALLFAVHPLQVEPVAWATGLKGPALGIALLDRIVAIRAIRPVGLATRAGRFSFQRAKRPGEVVALRSCDGGVARRHVCQAVRHVDSRSCAHYRPIRSASPVAADWHCAGAMGDCLGNFHWYRASRAADRVSASIQPWTRALIAGDSLAFYLQKLCAPFRLASRYPHSTKIVLSSWQLKVAWVRPRRC